MLSAMSAVYLDSNRQKGELWGDNVCDARRVLTT